jgi:hypothetical protein
MLALFIAVTCIQVSVAPIVGTAVDYNPKAKCDEPPIPKKDTSPPPPPPIEHHTPTPPSLPQQSKASPTPVVAAQSPAINPGASIKVEKRISALEKYDQLIESVRFYGGLASVVIGLLLMIFVATKCVCASDCWNARWMKQKRKTSVLFNNTNHDDADDDESGSE